MQSIAYIDTHPAERRSLLAQSAPRMAWARLTVVFASLGLWAALIGGLAMIAG